MKPAGLEDAIRRARMRLWEINGGDNPPSRSDAILAAVSAYVGNGASPKARAKSAAEEPGRPRKRKRPVRISEGEALSLRTAFEKMRPGGRVARLAAQMSVSQSTVTRVLRGEHPVIRAHALPNIAPGYDSGGNGAR